MPEPIGAASGITAGQPASSSFLGHYQIVSKIRQNDKALFDQYSGGFERLLVVGQQCHRIANDLEFYPIGFESLACKPGCANGVICVIASGRVRQDLHFRVEVIEKKIPFCRRVGRD
jgi:hypothetical protein